MILAAQNIRTLCKDSPPLIEPFHERQAFLGLTFGLSACGYDVRIAERVEVRPGRHVLGSTIERFAIPDYLRMTIHDKSSWARRGLAVQNTVAEPGWRGWLTLELSNHTALPIWIEQGCPIAQVAFDRLTEPTEQPYEGRYQDAPQGPQRAIAAE